MGDGWKRKTIYTEASKNTRVWSNPRKPRTNSLQIPKNPKTPKSLYNDEKDIDALVSGITARELLVKVGEMAA